MMKKYNILALVLALAMVLSIFAGCQPAEQENPVVYQDIDPADAVVHKDFTSVYDMIGSNITIDMVEEDENGIAWVTYEGTKYELGLDFLSMAMVYNAVPAGEFASAEAAYNEWWKLFIQRYNQMALEIPLYSNQYFDLYNAKIQGFKTTPYWGAASAIVACTIKEGNANSVILGSSTELSGAFRAASWGKSTPGSSDLDIQELTSGYATVETNDTGAMEWNMNALAEEPVAVKNDDGTLTYTIKLRNDMVFSDGSAINAKHFIAGVLANSTAVAKAAGGTGMSGLNFVGFEEFSAFDGSNEGAEGVSKYFSGIKLLDDYSFSVTLLPDYANYYYSMSYAGFSPSPLAMYLGENDVIVNENKECGLSEGFYAKAEKEGAEVYVMADVIVNNLKWNSPLPFSGPYIIKNYDESALVATLELNPLYPGDGRGKPSIETITYVKIISETQMDQFTTGQVDVLAGITGGDETKAALAVVNGAPDKYAETHYDRAGYGFIGLRCDYGPTSFTAVRQAIMYTINRNEFAQQFTGGYGSVVHGPYYEGFSAFQAVQNEIMLNQFAYSSDSAVEALVEGGWIYNVEGKEFNAEKDDVRYKKLEGYELSKQNIEFKSTDGKYKTVKIDGSYYMPLCINWFGTQPNNVTDMLITAWQANENANAKIGAKIYYTSSDFTAALGELLQYEGYGWDGVIKCNAVNYATGFNSAIYDFAFNFSINPAYYADYSRAYVMDEADFWENYSK